MIKGIICKEIIKENITLKKEMKELAIRKQDEINRTNAWWKNKIREEKEKKHNKN